MSRYDRDINNKLKQKFGAIDPHVGDWRSEKKPLIGCLLPILILVCIILWVL